MIPSELLNERLQAIEDRQHLQDEELRNLRSLVDYLASFHPPMTAHVAGAPHDAICAVCGKPCAGQPATHNSFRNTWTHDQCL